MIQLKTNQSSQSHTTSTENRNQFSIQPLHVSIADFYTQTLLHTDAFTHRRFYTQTPLHTDAFTHRPLLHTDAFTHRHFYTQKLLHTEAFTHRGFYTQTPLHTDALHTDAFTHRPFYTQTLLHSNTFHAQRLFTHRSFYTQKHFSHTETGPVKSQFYLSFWRSNLISRVRVAIDTSKSHFLLQFLTSNVHFVRKGCDGLTKLAILPQFFDVQRPFRARGLRWTN